MIGNSGPVAINPLLSPVPYNVERDFIPVSQISAGPNVLVVRSDAPFTSLKEIVSYAKQHPGKIAIGFTFAAKDAFGIYYRKADAATLGTQIKDGLAKLKADGTLVKIANKYKVPVADVK